jgi:serine protease inhibitor
MDTLVARGQAVRDLADRMLPAFVAAPEARSGDFACSPAGLWLVLAALAAGATGAAGDELTGLVGTSGPDAGAAVTAVTRELLATDALAVATGVWVNPATVAVRESYRESLPEVTVGPIDPPAIDAWVNAATQGLIERLPVRVGPGVDVVLANALGLRARWQEPFPASSTRPGPFTDITGTVTRVPTMRRDLSASDVWTVDGPAGPSTVVELRAERRGPGAPARVRLALGPPGAGPAAVLPATWAPAADRRPVVAALVRLRLPRLCLATTFDLLPPLRALGLQASFDPDGFDRLSTTPLAVPAGVGQALVRIAEEGVETAAATAVLMVAAFVPPPALELAFDRPFGLAVLDGTGAVPLVLGWQATAPRGA